MRPLSLLKAPCNLRGASHLRLLPRRHASGGAKATQEHAWQKGAVLLKAFLIPGLVLGLSLSMWPFFDLLVLPWACKKAILAPKFGEDRSDERPGSTPDVAAHAISELGALFSANAEATTEANIVILCGVHAPSVAKALAQAQGERCCGHIDFGNFLMMNPYELFAFRYLGDLGDLMNAYAKAALFLGSILSQRHPHVDAMLYFHDAASSYRRALVNLNAAGRQPILILSNVECLAHLAESHCCEESKALGNLMCLQTAQQTLSIASEGLADVLWVLPSDPEAALKFASKGIRVRASIFNVQSVRGQLVLRERR